jgi:dolichyl-phosphate beta-glucosyltransferase
LNLSNRQCGVRGDVPDFSLILPLYNPGERLRQTLAQLDAFVADANECWELVFACDGSTDGSAEMIKSWSKDRGDVQLVDYSPNRGKGYAVRQGLLLATAPYRIFTDIDLAYPFGDIRRVAWQLRAGGEAVIGSRAHPDSTIELSPTALVYAMRRQQQSQVFSKIVRTLLPLQQRDTQAGLKGFSKRVVQLIAPKLQCDGFGFDCELLTACVRHGLAVTEVPVHVRCDAGGSTTNFRSTLRMIRELWRMRQHWPANIPDEAAASRREAA